MESIDNVQQASATSSNVPRRRQSNTWTRWSRFLSGVLVILLVAFVVIPAVQRLDPIREVCDAIEEHGIDATALFYTESEVSGDAESSIRNAIQYSSRSSE